MAEFRLSNYQSLISSGSTSTSAPWMINDFDTINISWQSTASLGPSRLTIEISNADGLQKIDYGNASQTTLWSVFTGINLIGLPRASANLVNPGARWMRATVDPGAHSSVSAVNVLANGQRF